MAAKQLAVQVHNVGGSLSVVSTKPMPGTQWIKALTSVGCRFEVCTENKTILSVDDIVSLIGTKCNGVIGQLIEDWGDTLLGALKKAGSHAFSNMTVGYNNNVDAEVGTRHGILVGNTPGVLTETTAELAAALTLSAARRVVEADDFMRAGKYDGWLPTLFVGNLLKGQTVGIVGAGRIGTAYACMMVEGFKMNVIYYDLYQSSRLEEFVTGYGEFLKSQGQEPVHWNRASSPEEVLQKADVVSLHLVLDKTTFHLINKDRLALMKKEAILVNASRGPVVDEVALVEHLKANPMFRVGLDVFEDEPHMKPGLGDLPDAVVNESLSETEKEINYEDIGDFPLYASAKVVYGFGRGSKQMGIPTANLNPEELVKEIRDLPKGVYFGWVQVRGEGLDAGIHKMVMNIGNRPTFSDGDSITVEVHILYDYGTDFYGKDAAIVVLGFIRPEMKFGSLDALVERIGEDIKTARSSLEEEKLKSYQTDRFFQT